MLTVGEDNNLQFCLSYIIAQNEHNKYERTYTYPGYRLAGRSIQDSHYKNNNNNKTYIILHDIKIISRKYTFVKNAFPVVHVTYRLKSRTHYTVY